MRVAAALALALLAPVASPGRAEAPPPRPGIGAFLLQQGVARLAAEDPAGLGSEARAAQAWAGGRRAMALEVIDGVTALWDGEEALPISSELATALRRFGDWARLSLAARERPVTGADLRALVLAPPFVASVRELFDRCLDEAVPLDGDLLAPELGGEAVADGGLRLRRVVDPTREALAALASGRGDPDRLHALFREMPEAIALVDQAGQLERELELWKRRTERGVPLERRRRPLDLAVTTLLRNTADSFTLVPRQQLECIITHEWAGRLVGPWHLHPPAWGAEGLAPGEGPSPDDLAIARGVGQFLTIVFRPDGFDVHDLSSPVGGPAPALGPERRIEHRSAAWREHFARRHAEIARRLTTSP